MRGETSASTGYGVAGVNSATTGNAVGVYGESGTAGGFGGYFLGRGYFSNNVGIGTALANSPLTVAGIVESLSGGFKFPDGTTQTTAASGGDGGPFIPLNGAANSTEGFAVTGTYDLNASPPAIGAGTRLMWFPGFGAFRAGMVGGSEWDAANIGYHSVAMGLGTSSDRAQGYRQG